MFRSLSGFIIQMDEMVRNIRKVRGAMLLVPAFRMARCGFARNAAKPIWLFHAKSRCFQRAISMEIFDRCGWFSFRQETKTPQLVEAERDLSTLRIPAFL